MSDTTPPIDVMRIAAERLARTRGCLNATRAMQASPDAEAAYHYALIECNQAQRDMDAVISVAAEIGQ